MREYNPRLRIIDAAEDFRKLFGRVEFMGRDVSTPDYRFEIDTPTGGTVTFHAGATADHVREYLQREGWSTDLLISEKKNSSEVWILYKDKETDDISYPYVEAVEIFSDKAQAEQAAYWLNDLLSPYDKEYNGWYVEESHQIR